MVHFEPGRHREVGLAHDPLKAIVAPRPIGWITTLSPEGVVNLAPFSYFGLLSTSPAIVHFSPNGRTRAEGLKDSHRNVEATGEFVCNVATWDLRTQMNDTSIEVGPEVDEAALVGLDLVPSTVVAPPRVAASPVHLECRWLRTLGLPDEGPDTRAFLVLGTVVGVHIDERVLTPDGVVDPTLLRPIARLGGSDYVVVDEVFRMGRPADPRPAAEG